MPCNMKLYPDDWPAIRAAILRRAGGQDADPRIGARCERCGVRNYTVGRYVAGTFCPVRGNSYLDTAAYATSYADAVEVAELFEEDEGRHIVIVLTVAHLADPAPGNVAPENLAALCQRCHNRLDQPLRVAHRRARRRGPQLALGV